jgi:hypothetical protein
MAWLSFEPIKERSKPRTPGLSAGKGTIAEDFDADLTEEQLRELELWKFIHIPTP